MLRTEREILRMQSKGISQRSMATALHCSRHHVSRILDRAQQLQLTWPLPEDLTDQQLQEMLFPPKSAEEHFVEPDFDFLDKEMRKSGVTLTLLWAEYCETCRASSKRPFMYSQFCHRYRQHRIKSGATMHLDRTPGEQVEVDWAGQTVELTDPDTGEMIAAHIFVATMSYSQYTFIEAFLKKDLQAWIDAHNHLFRFLNGVPKIVVPDNLKTGVSRSNWYDPEIQRNYLEMAEHYDTVILPARVRAPKDKPNVEANVGNISTAILAKIRNLQFFSIKELNDLLWEKLEDFNERPFQRKEGSRASWFLEEKPVLLPLPTAPYELSSWHEAKVQFNYHISFDHMHYSVPYEYIKQKVLIKVTSHVIEIYSGHLRIATHKRLTGRKGQYSTTPAHMPLEHQDYLAWDEKRFLAWAQEIGACTHSVVRSLLNAAKIKQQAFRSCMGLLKLKDQYSTQRLEKACQRALQFSQAPSYKTVKSILKSSHDKLKPDTQQPLTEANPYAFTRGSRYYGGGR